MRYLLDVNALLALGFRRHILHHRVTTWLAGEPSAELATCSITELGFVRVLSNAIPYGLTVNQAREQMLRMKTAGGRTFLFLADDQDISHLPAWVQSSRQTIDGHLAALAIRHGSTLATLDHRIPKVHRIP